MDARTSQKVNSLMLANGKYSVSITQRGENYVVHLEKEESKKKSPKLEIVRDEEVVQVEKRGRGRPKRELPVMEIPEIKKHRGRPPKLAIVKDEVVAEKTIYQPVMKKRGRPAKHIEQAIVQEEHKRGRGRPKKTA